MADVAPARGKRARSPSPIYGADTLASPLEVLLKRRRRTEWASTAGIGVSGDTVGNSSGTSSFNVAHGLSSATNRMFAPPPPPVWQTTHDEQGTASPNRQAHGESTHLNPYDDNSSQLAASSPLRRHTADYDDDDIPETGPYIAPRAVDRRRARQWERLQDPMASHSAPNTSIAHQSSAAYTLPSHSSQPLPGQYHHRSGRGQRHSRSLFSSPAERERYNRHSQEPQATPERANNNMSSSPVRHNPPSSTPFRDDDWTEDERLREWGDEYAAQNSVLYSLHRARVEAIHNQAAPVDHDNPLVTPARIAGTHVTPSSLPTAYRHHQHTPLDTPGLISSEYASSPFSGPFSPLDAPAGPAPSPAHGYRLQPTREAESVRAGYEEANRLLAALNVARLRRNGPEHDEQASPLRTRTERGFGHDTMDEQW